MADEYVYIWTIPTANTLVLLLLAIDANGGFERILLLFPKEEESVDTVCILIWCLLFLFYLGKKNKLKAAVRLCPTILN